MQAMVRKRVLKSLFIHCEILTKRLSSKGKTRLSEVMALFIS